MVNVEVLIYNGLRVFYHYWYKHLPFFLQVNDGFPFSIALSWKSDAQNSETQQTVVFPKGNTLPSVKALTFYRSNTFTVDVVNVGTDDVQVPQKISTYTVSNIWKTSFMVIMIV